MQKGVLCLIFLGVFAFSFSFVSGEIFISQPDSLYNVGDEMNLSVTLDPLAVESDFLIIDLDCGNASVEIYKSPQTVAADTEKKIDLVIDFEGFLVQGLRGECFIEASFAGEQAKGQEFEISDFVSVNLNVEGIVFDPGNEFRVSGQATKANGELLNGFVDLEVEGVGINSSKSVTNGAFDFTLNVPENAPGGTHVLLVRTYEKDGSGITNTGEARNILKVSQIIKEIDVALDTQTVVPGNEVSFSILLYDQSNSMVGEDVGVSVEDPQGNILFKKLIKAGDSEIIQTNTTFNAGYWKIIAETGDFVKERTFFIEEKEEASFEIVDGSLVITNLGNVEYNKPVEISIGGVVEVKNIQLDKGETKNLRLLAPDGEYEISVNDGEIVSELGLTYLTGNAVSIRESEELNEDLMILFWVIFVVVLIIIAIHFGNKKLNKHKVKGGVIKKPKSKERKKVFGKKPETVGASSGGMINEGEKQQTSVIALKINNSLLLGKSKAQEILNKALLEAKKEGAKIYVDHDYRILIFSSLITGEIDNSLRAAKVAQRIERTIEEYNKDNKTKIEFGIGLHVGEMVVENRDGKFKFNSIGSTISIAKKTAGKSKGVGVISKQMHTRLMGKAKTERIQGEEVWKIKRIINREGNSDFVHKFLDRQKK